MPDRAAFFGPFPSYSVSIYLRSLEKCGLATIRGSLSQLRTMWRSWRRDRDIVHVERYEEVQNEVVELLVTYDALIYIASE